MNPPTSGVFRSLRLYNYRLWAAGALVSNLGTWMQNTGEDWLVLTQLTPHNASAVGTVMALQLGPQLLLLPWTGFAADHFNQRRLLLATQASMGLLALVLGALTLFGVVQLWQVYLFALLFGCAAAFDAPVRQTFVAEMVGDADLPNAVALNSTLYNGARLVGPAIAGVIIASVGTGWAFLLNGVSFLAVLVSLSFLRVADLQANARARRTRGSLTEGFRYVASRPDLKVILVMLFLIGTFGLNFPIFISTMAVNVFHTDARGFGLLSSIMAIGTLSGALLAAGGGAPRQTALLSGAAVFGLGCLLAAVAPGYWLFAGALIIIGVAALTFTNATNSLMQLSTEPAMRGRVMALRLGIALGGAPIGAPIVGGVADHFGPRWALGLGAAAGFAAAMVALYAFRWRDYQIR
ncbi:Putative major facilitator superfamily protein [Sodalis praecaptivus]|uniref:Putative major facilitator superfamily protein n=1 Tax=Sodalis praecaptivus TaxID=1239307 RepID=W0HTI5_9GAMM|nr:MFS transporter [Sodalis praecaptivus]AHF75525.1 Putative major facilitator superfamily protein [Sodalis praecaptivus]